MMKLHVRIKVSAINLSTEYIFAAQAPAAVAAAGIASRAKKNRRTAENFFSLAKSRENINDNVRAVSTRYYREIDVLVIKRKAIIHFTHHAASSLS